MALNQATIREFQAELDALLSAWAAKHNLRKSPQRIVYSAATLKLTVEFGDNDETGGYDPVLYRNLERNGLEYGLTTRHLGTEVDVAHDGSMVKMKLVGLRGSKLVMRDSKGSQWRCDARPLAPRILAAALPL